MRTPWTFRWTPLTRLVVLAIGFGLGATGCGDPVGPQEYRGIGVLDDGSGYPTEIVRLTDRVLVLDIAFRGPCRVTAWDVQATVEGQTVEVVPYFTAIPSVERCASVVRFIEDFRFLRGDSARFVVRAEPDVFPTRPVEVVLDTVVAFKHVR